MTLIPPLFADAASVPRRQEYKYFVPVSRLEYLRERFLRYMEHDPFCRAAERHAYSVRSIYLDTAAYRFYFEKIHGLKVRKKIRVRCYGETGTDASAFMEIKHKLNLFSYKDRAEIPYDYVSDVVDDAAIGPSLAASLNGHRPALEKFINHVVRLNLMPSVLVTYEREALVGVHEPDVRVTFDLNVRSLPQPDWRDMFREAHLRRVTDPWFILEIKFRNPLPFWMRQILRDYGLRRQAISKYCWGIDAWRFTEDVMGPY